MTKRRESIVVVEWESSNRDERTVARRPVDTGTESTQSVEVRERSDQDGLVSLRAGSS
jgi:hypothetical protein